MKRSRLAESAAVFAAVFLAYLSRLTPALAPWRDSGEMTTAGWTLGVAHPTSYPLYVLLARTLRALPLGNYAYRLNLLSAAAGAGAVALLFALIRRRRGLWPALAAAAWLGLNPVLWEVSQVSEMYSLWILSAAAVLAAALAVSEDPTERLWPGLCFLAGLSLANRLDLLLWAPGIVWLALSGRPAAPREDSLWAGVALLVFPAISFLSGSNYPFALLVVLTLVWRARGPGSGRRLALAAAAGAAGLSAYLYLPVRAATNPFLDWNHPATVSAFLVSVLRTHYGGTLDLISRRYAPGSLFGANLRLWGAHLWDAFGPVGLGAALWGSAASFRADRRRWLGAAACWWWSGPVFLLLANMPPNPHAAAVVRPSYLLSDVILVWWAAEGAAVLAARGRAWAPALAVAALAWPLWRGVPSRLDRRETFADEDFARNVLRAAPPGAVVVGKSDVQLYALWNAQAVEGLRPDVRIVSQGLAGAPWYDAQWSRQDPELPVGRLDSPEGWTALGAGGRPVLAMQDAVLPAPLSGASRTVGLLQSVAPPAPGAAEAAGRFVVLRGARRYGAAPDFFFADLIEESAQALYRRGLDLQRAGRADEARSSLRAAWSLQWVFPEVPVMLGYMDATAGRWADADAVMSLADALFAQKSALAADYRALPDVTGALRREAADALTQHGVALEKLGRRDEAAALYRRALALYPLAQTRYDLGVLAWGRDWDEAEEEFSEAVRLDPSNASARHYLDVLRARAAAQSSGKKPDRMR
ncbi:MAG: DUF2723 domain-containing protein [Elusimicrobia bacterium]|nr:DUF2723 domain-containing protein [Elusimicrobiota bacterium]